MRKRDLTKIFAAFLLTGSVLAGCGTDDKNSDEKTAASDESKQVEKEDESEEANVDFSASFEEAKAELSKAKEDKEVDFDKVTSIYESDLQELVQKRDQEFEDTVDEHISTALEAGKDGSLDQVVVAQLFDKLMQKVFYTTMKHEFTEVAENWGNTEEVNEEIEEAKEFYEILEPTVEKRDQAYGTKMIDAINGGFSEMEKAVEEDDELGFQLGKQVVDKTLMKTFYLASGALPNGYAMKASMEAKEDAEAAKAEQAEGWAFYQSLASYLSGNAPEEAEMINNQFDLQTDVTSIDPEAVNHAFVRGFSKIALHEYEESEEYWGEDKSAITALEGALFIDLISSDIKSLMGEESYESLSTNAQSYLEAVKSQDKEKAEGLRKDLEKMLNDVMAKANK
ncbi:MULTISPECIES: hypothetical protein [Bacillaceae]|uniref:hypothetical protein n=1 Tax=Bacillaceae TaxID=186817 RepID=UPI001C59784B|nr:hypothetical protein [Rossellomorea sp. YZS02]MBW3111792.1 hypothetical protein [Bacillus sp. MCCB 382]MDX8342070.1 hypothetical protein [Rossellomorea sp. YZS02]